MAKGMAAARLQCHHAVQLNTRLARALVAPKDDDSHTSLDWDRAEQALAGQCFGAGRLDIRISDLSLGLQRERLSLDRLTMSDAVDWLAGLGIDREALLRPIHFGLEDHPLLHGGRFEAAGNEAAFEELSRCYAEAADALDEIHTPVRCWPHHFDIATLIPTGSGSIGVGMSPGDASYPEPYYYVTSSPIPAAGQLPALRSRGSWRFEDWTGAVLTWDRFAAEAERPGIVREFLHEAIGVLKSAQSSSSPAA